MPSPLKIDAIEDMPCTPASDVKKIGWRGVMKSVDSSGHIVVTNHNEPQAVIMSIEAYGAIRDAIKRLDTQAENTLDDLRNDFDKRLASLNEPGAGDRLRSLMADAPTLDGAVKAGSGY